MKWKTLTAATITGTAACAMLLPAAPARAKGDAQGSLAQGGVARGDISMDAGETDRISVDLVAGQSVDITYTAGFLSDVTLTNPSGGDVSLGFGGGKRFKVTALGVTESGTYVFTVSSADGSQGTYSLAVRPKWAKTVAIAGTGTQTISVEVPASSKLGCTVVRATRADGDPSISSVLDPKDAELLTAPVTAKKGRATLAPLDAADGGTYRLTVTPANESGAWTGSVTRRVAAAKPNTLSLLNGLDVVGWNDGVNLVFSRQCAGCHGWANSYAGAKGYAMRSIEKIRDGTMPKGGRLPADQIALIESWIATGRTR